MEHGNLKSRQIKAARALLDWSQEDLAHHSGLSVATIRKLELGHMSPRGKTSQSIRRALEDNGLEFLEPDGVRHRPEEIIVYQGHEGAKAFYDDVYQTAKKKGGDIVVARPSDDEHFMQIAGDYAYVHMERMVALQDKVRVKCIVSDNSDSMPTQKSLPAVAYCEYRWLPKHYARSVPFYVYDDKYAIIATETGPSPKITVIQSRVVAEAFRQQFYSMWDKATPLNTLEFAHKKSRPKQ